MVLLQVPPITSDFSLQMRRSLEVFLMKRNLNTGEEFPTLKRRNSELLKEFFHPMGGLHISSKIFTLPQECLQE
jgi:hypothetical protein